MMFSRFQIQDSPAEVTRALASLAGSAERGAQALAGA
jgi:hypothetical protein